MANWILKKDGYHKKKVSPTKGNASYFQRPAPPVRDGATGHPIKDGQIDWKSVIEKANQNDQ